MTYTQGLVIQAVDYNTFRTNALSVYGVGTGNNGYGQTGITLPTVVAAVDVVESLEWTNLRNMIEVCALHQGTGTALIPPVASLQVGDTVIAHDGITDVDNIPLMLTNINTNRLNSAVGDMTVLAGVRVVTGATAWNTSVTATVAFDFTNENNARWFFNSGGEIRLTMTRAGGTVSPQNTAWTNLLNNIGTISMNHNDTDRSGTVGTALTIGYYNLTGAFQDILTATMTAANYTTNTVTVRARRLNFVGANGGNGDTVEIRFILTDAHTGPSDTVNGTFTATFDLYKATSGGQLSSPNIVTPTDTVTGALTYV